MSRRRGVASWWRPALVIVPVLICTAVAVTVLIKVLAPGSAQDRLDTVRTGLAIGAGIGALITLALALRRQQATEHDASERRLTELYVKAVDQLGSDKPAVRHGGLYALERVAQDNPGHRQTIVDVICAYLRAPYSPPCTPANRKLGGIRAPLRPARTRPPALERTASDNGAEEARQEREVRLTAQRILQDHLQTGTSGRSWRTWFPRPAHTYWPNIDLDLTGATLIDLDLTGTTVRNARFRYARFDGETSFQEARFGGTAWFYQARFDGETRFFQTRFDGEAWFGEAQFNRIVWFDAALFRGDAGFQQAQFDGEARFFQTRFSGDAWLQEARFNKTARFDEAQFDFASFSAAQFDGLAQFSEARFNGAALFSKARFNGAAKFEKTQFHDLAQFSEARFNGAAQFGEARFNDETRFMQAQFHGTAVFDEPGIIDSAN